MLTLQGHFTELVSKRNEVSPVKSVLQCQFFTLHRWHWQCWPASV